MELGPIQTKWIESLEAHPERQGVGQLGQKFENDTYVACCLGEGGLIAGVCYWDSSGRLSTIGGGRGLLRYCYDALGLHDDSGQIENDCESLSSMNDNGVTWPEIAAFIRKNPEAVFARSV